MPTLIPNGFLLAIEGIDGAGKTTQAAKLAERLGEAGVDVVRTKEPTDGPWGRKLRESATSGRLSAEDELDYFIRDRREHVEQCISPAMEAGKLVIVDRYYFSTVAYQGARGMDLQELLRLNESFAPPPNLLIILQVSPHVGLQRIRQRGDKANHFETAGALERVAKIFAGLEFKDLRRIDGLLPPEDITAGILEILYEGVLSTCDSLSGGLASKGNVSKVSNGDVWGVLGQLGVDDRAKQ
ncbi:dTMP kinase [Myxococcus sp. AB025B]|uniref:dTMP kinase n=1 Tax=Myxococcus sp. AB025B TaxID=2562794 RepID=UPI001142E84C|nr:dTMP kinase [Myxococcus sp. AB025B]